MLWPEVDINARRAAFAVISSGLKGNLYQRARRLAILNNCVCLFKGLLDERHLN